MSGLRNKLASILADLREVQPREWRFAGLFILALYLFLGCAFWVLPFPWGAIFAFLVLGGIIIYRTVYQAKTRRMLEAGLESMEELRDEVLEVCAWVIEHRDELQVLVPRLQEQLGEHSKELGERIEEIRERLEKLFPPGRPRLPTKPQVRSRWRATWRHVKGQWKQGSSSYKNISDWLCRVHPDLNCAPDTLADIIAAGEAGLLD